MILQEPVRWRNARTPIIDGLSHMPLSAKQSWRTLQLLEGLSSAPFEIGLINPMSPGYTYKLALRGNVTLGDVAGFVEGQLHEYFHPSNPLSAGEREIRRHRKVCDWANKECDKWRITRFVEWLVWGEPKYPGQVELTD